MNELKTAGDDWPEREMSRVWDSHQLPHRDSVKRSSSSGASEELQKLLLYIKNRAEVDV